MLGFKLKKNYTEIFHWALNCLKDCPTCIILAKSRMMR
jgi:hypothetical protein